MASTPPALFHAAMPRYHQIAQLLRQRAALGSAAGQGFTEHGLCAEFGVSRTTIRQALALLKRDGVLRSRPGVGTRIVSGLPAAAPYTRSSGDPLHAALGTKPRIVAFSKSIPPREIADFLKIECSEPALRVDRVHELDGTPLSLVVSYLPAFLATKLTRAALRGQSMHELLWGRFGLLQKRSTHTIRVARADGAIARHLGVALTEPVLHIRSQVYLDDGRPIRWTDNYFRADRYQYTAEMHWSKPKPKRKK